MPTKRTNISLKEKDVDLLISLRELVEKKNQRLSLAETIRLTLECCWNNPELFKKWVS